MNKSRLYTLLFCTGVAINTLAQPTPACQMEKLDRGVVAVRPSFSNFISWRLLGTDAPNTTFTLLRDGKVVKSDLTVTNYTDTGTDAKLTSKYQVLANVDGQVVDTSKEVTPWNRYLTLSLDRPATGANGGTYTPNDCSVGDVDGDGEYELFLKWDPSNSHDNSQSGVTDNVIIDCYKLDGTKLWRIDLGPNIRAGAHYTQFMVYDFDGDGRAEMMCKTAPGSVDGTGAFVNQAATDATIIGHKNNMKYANSNGHVLSGPEYLTVFDGLTGAAKHTTWYLPGRAGTGNNDNEDGSLLGMNSSYPSNSGFWGDSYGNRSERYLAGVAYINGADKPACGIFCRGYYTRAYIWAVSFDGTRLHSEWLHASPNSNQSVVFGKVDPESSFKIVTIDGDQLQRKGLKAAPNNTRGSGSKTMYGNGNHNLSIADVDGDGCDEIIWGSAALNNDGYLLYATGFGHGDAIHMGKMIPDREGYQVYEVHEEGPGYGWDLHDAATGEILFSSTGSDDNGRGMAADIISTNRGWEFWSSKDNRKPQSAETGAVVSTAQPSMNFRIYWNGTCQDQLLDGGTSNTSLPVITAVTGTAISEVKKFSTNEGTPRSCNSTKSTPCLQADILGDWREELVYWNGNDPSQIMIYTTSTNTDYRVPTLMHDHTYRMGICWQNTAYNQPPHLGYYLPDYIEGKLTNGVHSVAMSAQQTEQQVYDLQGRRLNGMKPGLNIIRKNGLTRKVMVK